MRVATQDYFGILYNFTVFLYLTVGQLVKLAPTEFTFLAHFNFAFLCLCLEYCKTGGHTDLIIYKL